MFDRFVRLTQARRAVASGRPEEALRLLSDPLVAGQRRTEDLRGEALAALVARARERADRGDFDGAAADVDAVLAWQAEHPAASALRDELRVRRAGAERDRDVAGAVRRAIRALIEGGDLAAAEARLAAEQVDAQERASAARTIAARRAAAARLLGEAKAVLAKGQAGAACDLLRQAGALDRQLAGLAEANAAAARALTAEVVDAVRAELRRGAVFAACERIARERARWPELSAQREFAAVERDAGGALRAALLAPLRQGDVRAALAAYAQLDARLVSETWLGELAAGFAALRDGIAAVDCGDPAEARRRLDEAAAVLRFPAVEALRADAAADAAAISAAVETARDLAGRGESAAARETLERALLRWPLAAALHEQMKVLQDGAEERQRKLAEARAAAAAGRLREAAAQALALCSPGAAGEDARRLHAEVQARLDVVHAGVDQVKRSVHGRASGSIEGLAHCIARLDELAKVQADHEELPRLRQALVSERRGLELIRDLVEWSRAPSGDRAVEAAREVVALRSELLGVDRLDARLLEAFDAVAGRCETEVAAGRLRTALRGADALGVLALALPAEAQRVAALRAQVARASEAAADAVRAGRQALAENDVAAAESALDLAQRWSSDADEVASFARELDELRARLGQIAEVQAIAARRDYARAQQKLAGMSPTPAALRTRIFDLKRSLAQAQGLDAGFILRVDEGGEYLVLRRDSITIGNLRDGRADLALLANIAGQHARVQRRMSFHGGMEDRIIAERGSVTVNGQPVREHRLRDGDEICLGGNLKFGYRLPSGRSLTALLRVYGGFQVRGTDKILLLKDRGRDGSILIGNSKDAHVPVPVSGPEVEVYAGTDGQVRVRCTGPGTMDGRPFQQEHPVTAGALVCCGDVSFVLLPLPTA
ncbi:MAG TPA: FHA domain-containing protein [Planctomycetota bacterium]|nr:FHA domain-containing protein [Planctomycetota bacterium]